jgi:hypothetical protein
VAKLANDGFDPKAFLAKVGVGKTILKLAKNKHVFERGDVARSANRQMQKPCFGGSLNGRTYSR